MVKLRPSDFRHGSRNRHIDSVTVDVKNEFIAAGTNQGEIYIWRVHFHNLRQKSAADPVDYLGTFKVHSKSIHQLKYSGDGELLYSGSGDGTACLWDMRPFIQRHSQNSNGRDNCAKDEEAKGAMMAVDSDQFFSECHLVHKFDYIA